MAANALKQRYRVNRIDVQNISADPNPAVRQLQSAGARQLVVHAVPVDEQGNDLLTSAQVMPVPVPPAAAAVPGGVVWTFPPEQFESAAAFFTGDMIVEQSLAVPTKGGSVA